MIKASIKVLFLFCVGLSLLPVVGHAQQSANAANPKRVLLLNWYNKDDFANVRFDASFQATLQSAGPVELYTEYLESNRFPNEDQVLALHDYLKRKYADRFIDVIVANSDASLNFFLKDRGNLFPQTPIVFVATKYPSKEEMATGPGLTGAVVLSTQRETLDLALRLHPRTQQVFVISGTLEHDKRIETLTRHELESYENRITITYLTDLSLEDLIAKAKNSPEHSILLHVWQQSQTEQGKVLESADLIDSIARSATVPVYSMSFQRAWLASGYANDGSGIMGGYVTPASASGSKAAEIALRVLNGTRPQDIPIERPAPVPMLNWRELQRWGISEGDLPLGSLVMFREFTFWELYKWRILGVGVLLLLQTSLIAGLLVERARRSKATHGLSESEERYRNVVQTQTELICRYLPDTTITFVNDAYCRYFGKSRAELIGLKFIELIPEHSRQDTLVYVQSLLKNPRIQSNEHQAILADGSITWQHWIDHVITNGNGRVKELQGIGRDITERKLAEEELQISERRFATAFSANPQPMSLTTLAEGRYIDVNESFLQMSGYAREEVIGNTSLGLGIFQAPEDREKLVGPLRSGKSVQNLELMFRTKTREFRILLSSAELINLGGQQCVLVASSDITDRKRLEEERLNAENELSQLTARLFTLQDEERRRIARELHDGTAQNLFAISIDIDLMRKQTANGDSELNSLLDESASLCEQSLQEIRTLSYLLHPPLLDHAGLVSALQWYVDGFIKRSGIAVNLVALESVGRMGSEIETALFRIVQESLTNIRRHSGSETAGIRLWRDEDEIFLEIHDHGKGIKLTDSIGPIDETHLLGVGIPGMRQRLRQLGGRLDIVTSASGTVVTAIIPLKETSSTNPTA